MVHKFSFIVLFVLVVIGLIVLFSGCHRRPGRFCSIHGTDKNKAEWISKRIVKELKLTKNQQIELDRIKGEIHAKKAEFKVDHDEIKNAVLSQVKSDSVDQAALNGLFEDKELEFKEIRAFLINKFAEFHIILTPEQRLKLAEKMETFHSKNCS